MYIKHLTDCLPHGEYSIHINVFPIANNNLLSTFINSLKPSEFNSFQQTLFFQHNYNYNGIGKGAANDSPWAKSKPPPVPVKDPGRRHHHSFFTSMMQFLHVMDWHFMNYENRIE